VLIIHDIQNSAIAKANKFVLDYETVANAFMEVVLDETEPYYYLKFPELVCLQHLCIIDFPDHLIHSKRLYFNFSGNGVVCVEVITEHPNPQIWQIKFDSKKITNEEPLALHQIPHPECILEIPNSKPIVTEFTLPILPSNLQGLPNDYSEVFQELCYRSNILKELLNSYSEDIQWLINGLNYLNV
jgi:hypothetical protein